ncbi:MAG: PHP domain-containing protein [Anaerolineae bacterium]
MLHWLAVDLHVHTVLSACAEVEMMPPLIVEQALALGLAGIAITDHNSAENAAAVQEAAAGTGLVVLAGLELQSREDVHLLALMGDAQRAAELQQQVYSSLPDLPNRPEYFGEQLVVSAAGDYVRLNDRLLQTATRLSVEEAVALVQGLGGLCLAAHIDRPTNSLVSNLGFVPADLTLDGVEVSRHCDVDRYTGARRDLRDLAVVSSSDAHRLSELSARTLFLIEQVSLAELALALRRQRGRAIRVQTIGSAAR